MNDLLGKRVYHTPTRRPHTRRDGTEKPPARLGKVHELIFSPDGRMVVGAMVKRPDVAGMVKRDDVFVATDRLERYEKGFICLDDKQVSGEEAAEALGFDWDSCLIWGGMDVRTSKGVEMGYVSNVVFDEVTGMVETICVSDGAASRAIVGEVDVPASYLLGYKDGYMVVRQAATKLGLSGGAAAAAGEGFAKAKEGAKDLGKKAAPKAGEAFDKGSFAVGRALGKAKRAIEEAAAEDPEDIPQDPPAPAEEVLIEHTRDDAAHSLPASGKSSGSEPGSKNHGKGTKTYAPVVEKPAAKGNNGNLKGSSKASTTHAAQGKQKSQKPKGEPASEDRAAGIARGIGKSLGSTKGMFEGFKREFDKSSK